MTSIKPYLLLAGLSSSVCFVPAIRATTLLSETFDSMTAGLAPTGWTVSQPADTSALVTDAKSSSVPNSLHLNDGSATGSPAASVFFDSVTTGLVTVNVDILATVTNKDSLYVKLRNTSNQDLGGIRFNTNGTFAYMATNGTWTASSITYSANTWYSVEITYDLDNKTYSASVSGTALITDAGFRSTVSTFNAGSMLFQSLAGGPASTGEAFIDNLIVSGPSTIPEPSTLAGIAGVAVLLGACWRRRR